MAVMVGHNPYGCIIISPIRNGKYFKRGARALNGFSNREILRISALGR